MAVRRGYLCEDAHTSLSLREEDRLILQRCLQNRASREIFRGIAAEIRRTSEEVCVVKKALSWNLLG